MDTSYLCLGRQMDLAKHWCALTSVARPEKRYRLHDADKVLSIGTKKCYNIISLFVVDGKNRTGQRRNTVSPLTGLCAIDVVITRS
jgi:hypothetical protein